MLFMHTHTQTRARTHTLTNTHEHTNTHSYTRTQTHKYAPLRKLARRTNALNPSPDCAVHNRQKATNSLGAKPRFKVKGSWFDNILTRMKKKPRTNNNTDYI
jgi:hypothetical protein